MNHLSMNYVSLRIQSPTALLMSLALVACGTAEPVTPQGPESLPEQQRVEPAAQTEEGPSAETPAAAEERFTLPEWQLEDVQPASERFGERYGLQAFYGTTFVVVLLEGFCPFCRSNSVVASDVRAELRDDTVGRQAWQSLRAGASKHDTFVFAPSGERKRFIQGSYTGDADRWRSEVTEAVRAISAAP